MKPTYYFDVDGTSDQIKQAILNYLRLNSRNLEKINNEISQHKAILELLTKNSYYELPRLIKTTFSENIEFFISELFPKLKIIGRTIEDCISFLSGHKIKTLKKEGSGAFSSVYETKEGRIAKVGRIDIDYYSLSNIKKIATEYEIAKEAGSKNIGPKVYGTYLCCSCKGCHLVIEMEKMIPFKKWNEISHPKSLKKKVYKVIEEKSKELHDIGVIHKDLHAGNVVIKNDEPFLIDFGVSEYIKNIDIFVDDNYINPDEFIVLQLIKNGYLVYNDRSLKIMITIGKLFSELSKTKLNQDKSKIKLLGTIFKYINDNIDIICTKDVLGEFVGTNLRRFKRDNIVGPDIRDFLEKNNVIFERRRYFKKLYIPQRYR